jgi:hypothetical protein
MNFDGIYGMGGNFYNDFNDFEDWVSQIKFLGIL